MKIITKNKVFSSSVLEMNNYWWGYWAATLLLPFGMSHEILSWWWWWW